MNYLFLGFFTGLSLILAIGAQNIFVVEQGLKKQYIFLVCLICSISDFILIFLGIFLFQYFGNFFNSFIELILNIFLFIFLIHFIYKKIFTYNSKLILKGKKHKLSIYTIIIRTLGFTYLNPHVYSDTVFFLGNFSKNFDKIEKYYFGTGASCASLLFFFLLGYLSKYFSKYLKNRRLWKYINMIIISFMFFIALLVLAEIFKVELTLFE
tara:strand:+ start:2300 stop:2929 length:630 start_codon:yes stop_codon:yes gene_type:complete